MYSKNKPAPRILMLAASLPPLPVGGAEIQAIRLAKKISEQSISVTFITPGKQGLEEEGQVEGIRVFRVNSIPSRLFGLISGLKKKAKLPTIQIEYDDQKEITDRINRPVGWPTRIYYQLFYWGSLSLIRRKKIEFDVIHAHTMEWSAIVASKLGKHFNKPVVIKDSTMNGFQSLSRFPNGEELQKEIIQRSHFVAMTQTIEQNLLAAGIPSSKIDRIPNGIELKPWNEPKLEGEEVLFVGNLYQQPAKGVDILLKAWANVILQFPSAKLNIAGDGDLGSYRAYTTKLGIDSSVSFLGRRNDLDDLYAKAAVFVLPSRREGMSNSLMEAMMHGLPSVATRISGNMDLIKDGVSGKLVPASDIEALARGIVAMLTNKGAAKEMGKAARRSIELHYNINVIAQQYIKLYQGILIN